MLIVLEGLDGAGKSTQVRKLRSYLESFDPSLEYIHFPRYDSPVYGDLIGKFLRGGFGDISSVHPQLVALLFAEDRHSAKEHLRSILDSGGLVLLDRYVYSNIAYQCAKLESESDSEQLRQWIVDTEYGNFGLPRPDLNIFLDAPLDFVRKNLSDSRAGDDRAYLCGAADIHEADIQFQARVREMYLRQARLDPDFVIASCSAVDGTMLPPDETFSRIKEIVDRVL